MKKTDKFLIGIVVGIVLLIAVAFAVALNKPEATYKAEDTPEGIAFNYLFALQQRDYERAYGYLSPKIIGYPKNVEAFEDDIRDYSWSFRDLEDGSLSLEIISVDISGQRAVVKIQSTNFYENGLFDSGQYTNTFDVILRQDQDGKWKITEADNYWLWCWDNLGGCK